MLKSGYFLLLLLFSCSTLADVELVKVDKSKRRMYLIDDGQVIREFRIALGKSPKGHKQQEGDQRTPEGRYYLDFVTEHSHFYRSMHISYPNLRDKHHAETLGVDPGGEIKIHGLKTGYAGSPEFIQSFDWTNGCIAITNQEMDEFLSLVKIGTPIEIQW
ncbi:L,D-transpeptidase family protein [Vibrio fluvialis]|uniref:L,D-transpeptidase family protein n=1 Tax=Vibrio fluvialis TaxID=676 RepID=UPI0005093BC5|nr:L,D-transpeptidase family protein [Vibrio fluvialis]EKO3485961.1 L,D-transpeptidase family protein [Vibrio fluvialis]EKO3930646.1 L,D-transpeptidase family protein [Vibrio fluvialis]MBL4240189.1 L,D-transpeptidase family protein [Vibrio fluvialis]MBL4266332.1 L,D-transpeptidase family protein [Vibrio fluvialis]MBL4268898.1 L,D-transpeptidase family protein [Vibrio fluvialis]